jgi:hypothetical protein
MPIRDLPRSFRRLGKIRLGEQVAVMNGDAQATNRDGTLKFRPAKLGEFRLTSPSRELLSSAAEVYGGSVRAWEGSPGEEDEWELYSATRSLDVVIPPVRINDEGDVAGGPFMQWNEMWNKGGCVRRCDGFTETISGGACASMTPMCPVDHDVRHVEAALGRACKMTTRLMVILPKVPDLGMWMLETHGYYAAVELGAFMEFLARRAGGQFVEATLRLESRTVKRKGKTHHFAVPVIELPQATAGELLAGVATPRAIAAASGDDPGRPFEEAEPVEQPVLVDSETVRAFAVKVREAGFDDDARHAIVHRATRGRVTSSRAVRRDEWAMVERVYRALLDGLLAETVVDGVVRLTVVDVPATGPGTAA